MAKNELLTHKTVKASFTLTNGSASSVQGSGVYLPAGAIVTNVRWIAPAAVTLTGASGTVVPRVGTVNLIATLNISALGASRTLTSAAVVSAYVPATGEFQLVEGASNNAAATATYDYYIDYFYVA